MIRDITLGQYYKKDSIVHSLDPRVKLVATLIFLISLFISTNIFAYILATAYLITAIILCKVPFGFIIRGLKSLLLLLFISIAFNLFLTPGKVVFSFYAINITKEGIILALKMAIRLVYLVIGSSILTLTTTPSKLTDGLEKGLSFLNVIKVPVAEIALMMSIALRFIPTLIEEVDKIMNAQMSRGANFEKGNLIEKAKALIPLLVPLFVSAFKRANDLAYAMESRCYVGDSKRTKLRPLKYKRIDYITYIYLLVFIILIFLTRYIKIDSTLSIMGSFRGALKLYYER
ncbi:MAG: energy-coupling factor transporter transmembrane protein EcfT [Lachnospiraceae bacterium]|nr:energy-coupling factor transporter transmembrane protein EcfT [Lachnospiraceae bacterium]